MSLKINDSASNNACNMHKINMTQFNNIGKSFQHFCWRFTKMFAEHCAEIAHAGKSTKLAHFGNAILARLYQSECMIEPDGFNKVGW